MYSGFIYGKTAVALYYEDLKKLFRFTDCEPWFSVGSNLIVKAP